MIKDRKENPLNVFILIKVYHLKPVLRQTDASTPQSATKLPTSVKCRQPTHTKLPRKKTINASNDHAISFKTFDASYVLTSKSGKVVAKFVGGKHKGSKTCVWVPKVLVSNAKGPKTVWVPKVKN